MALQECGLNLNQASRELQPHGSTGFPCAGYACRCTERTEDMIPWHWHEEMEIAYVEQGQAVVKAASKTFLLNPGELVVINSNVIHFAAGAPECRLHSLVFHPRLITGTEDSVFAETYLRPLLSCGSFLGYQMDGKDGEKAAGWFRRAFEVLEEEPCGFEFTVRENLSHICLSLYEIFKSQMETTVPALSQDHIRIRTMLDYIHENFSGNMSLADISGAAGVSERECLRCFQKMLQISPIQYLLKYRVMQGARMFLRNPADTVSRTAAACGFDSPSNFSNLFKRYYNCTPREYRERHRKGHRGREG